MQRRSPAAPFFLPFVTFGIYSIVWYVKTKNEMNQSGTRIPTAWLIIVPIANIVWIWKYAVGVAEVTDNRMGRHMAFWVLLLLGLIGTAIVQSSFNNAIDSSVQPEAVPAVA